jgi:hypothetical protein
MMGRKSSSKSNIYVSILISILLLAALAPSSATASHRERDPLRAKFRPYRDSKQNVAARARATAAEVDSSAANDAAPKLPRMHVAAHAVKSAASAAMALAKRIADGEFDPKGEQRYPQIPPSKCVTKAGTFLQHVHSHMCSPACTQPARELHSIKHLQQQQQQATTLHVRPVASFSGCQHKQAHLNDYMSQRFCTTVKEQTCSQHVTLLAWVQTCRNPYS